VWSVESIPMPHHSDSLSPSPSSSQAPSSSEQSSRNLVDRARSFIAAHSNDPIVHWALKHADNPVHAGKRWVVEHLQFPAAMFDPTGLKARYLRLVSWEGGLWINYWTHTRPRSDGTEADDVMATQHVADNDAALLDVGVVPSSPSTSSQLASPTSPVVRSEALKEEDHKATKEQELLKSWQGRWEADVKNKEKGIKAKLGHHFVVLPTGLGSILGGGDKWEKFLIAGAEDEVAAHTGLFIRHLNVDYERLIERVGKQILEWCEKV